MPGETIGYLTEEQATDYIRANMRSDSRRRALWETLEAPDREALLRAALAEVESVRYSGVKADPRQALAFPRRGQQEIPPAVPAAQALEACALALCADDTGRRAALQAQGVSSFSAGSLRESYSERKRTRLHSREAEALLSRYRIGVSRFD